MARTDHKRCVLAMDEFGEIVHRAARLFDLQQQPSFPTDLFVTADFMCTVKIPPSFSRANFVSDLYQRLVQFILTTASLVHADTTQQAIIISLFEAYKLLPSIQRTSKVTLHLFALRLNRGFASLN
jgi:hypothetical protein